MTRMQSTDKLRHIYRRPPLIIVGRADTDGRHVERHLQAILG